MRIGGEYAGVCIQLSRLQVVCWIACLAFGLSGGSSALACTSSTNVGTGGELASVLGCFIEQSPSGNHEIIVVQPISVRTDTLPSIDVFDESVGLTIKGGVTNAGAYSITGNGEEPVFRINGPASVGFIDLTITP